ncbi:MAG: MerR family transcriptional regulator [Actinobacteria bacterium]|nr:MerR family transcriptional regulator [Actinomycetota bacterium]
MQNSVKPRRADDDQAEAGEERVSADRLDDPDYPAYTTGQGAAVLGVQQAFLRALDDVGAVTPVRSAGNHRRYTRRQLAYAQRIREQFDQGHNLSATLRILSLQDELATERARGDRLRRELSEQPGRDRDVPGGEVPDGE